MYLLLTILFLLPVVYGTEKCCYPKQMEGRTTLVTGLKIYFYRNARFAIDFTEGRFIILHPQQDEEFILHNFADGEYFERFKDGSCLKRPLRKVEVIKECIPDDYVMDNYIFGEDSNRAVTDLWARGKLKDVNFSYIVVKKPEKNNTCVPEAIQQNLNQRNRQRTYEFYDVSTSIGNKSMLFPDISDCTENHYG